ncbi:hypothetical protein M1N63_01950 [Thermodesulfovibrionales bacterium]|nr:hypothetical protein [Thermodesulfovibrionales bacterium]
MEYGFILEIIRPKHLVHRKPDKTIHPPITMHVDTPILGQQIPHENEPFINHGDEGVSSLAPGVAIGDFLKDIGLLGEGVTANFDIHEEIRAHVEGRIDIDQFQPALGLNILSQRPVLQ